VLSDRRTRFDDKLFVVLLLLPAVFAGDRYLECRAQINRIALHASMPRTLLAKAPALTELAAGNTSIVHRF
jgi:hypothetical protein